MIRAKRAGYFSFARTNTITLIAIAQSDKAVPLSGTRTAGLGTIADKRSINMTPSLFLKLGCSLTHTLSEQYTRGFERKSHKIRLLC